MGNLCSKSSNKPDHFAQPGRVLGSSGQSAGTVPTPQKITSSTPGRTLGGQPGTASENNAKTAAARAAEERAAANQHTGKLGRKLQEEQKKTRNELLAAGSEQERRARDADTVAEARTYN